jgi:membrane protein DedA with SNARE-associated domain
VAIINFHSLRTRRLAAIGLIVAALAASWFGLRTYRSFLLLQSAYQAGVPATSHVRPWMTLRYVATTYRTPAEQLLARLELAPTTDLDTSLKTIAERLGLSPFEYVRRVQLAIAAVAAGRANGGEQAQTASWFGSSEEFLSALLVYGYPALALILLLGAVGLPVPTGFATALAGALVSQGHMTWAWAGIIAVAASVLGDLVAYGIGRWLGEQVLERRGRWFGFTAHRRARVEWLFRQWGRVTILLTRTLVSHLSSVVSLLAGVGRYRIAEFAGFAVIGRVLWTSVYLGLGFAIGADLDAATEFLRNLTGVLISITILLACAWIVWWPERPPARFDS